MEKRNWLWKKRSSEKSSGGTESSGSISSNSERYSDDQDASKTSPNHNTESPEFTSKSIPSTEDVNDDNVKRLMEKLSAALVNICAKEDLVKQHSKVAEEAVAGWEKAENEMAVLKLQLEAVRRKNLALEDRSSHLDAALKECVRQLRQAREEQEQKIQEAVVKKTNGWESTKTELESQLQELQRKLEATKYDCPAQADPDIGHRVEYLEKENSVLQHELVLRLEELEIQTIERDLSTHAAETASRQYLESIKKVGKLEAECRRLKAASCKSSSMHDLRSVSASSIYVESLTDSQSDGGERLNAVEIDICKMSGSEPNKCEPICSDSMASTLIAERDQFKNGMTKDRNVRASTIQIDLMDDFLEMERLAALPETLSTSHILESENIVDLTVNVGSSLRSELEIMTHRTAELEEKVQNIEAEKLELEIVLSRSQDHIKASKLQLREAHEKLEELQKELHMTNDSKSEMESQLIGRELETLKLKAKIDSLEAELEKERALSAKISVKCSELDEELSRKKNEVELQIESSSSEVKLKQENLVVAAGKLEECQRTIASLGKQLQSLATLEDFLIDTTSIPDSSGEGSLVSHAGEEWKSHYNETVSPKRKFKSSGVAGETYDPFSNKNGNSPPSTSSSTSSATSSNHVSSEKNRHGFAKFFSRSKSGVHLEI